MQTYDPTEKKWTKHVFSDMFWSLLSLSAISKKTKYWIVTNWEERRSDEPGTFLVFIPGDKNRTIFQEHNIRKPSEWCRILMWQPSIDIEDGVERYRGNWQELYSKSGSGIRIAKSKKWEKLSLPVGVMCNTELPMDGNPRPNLVVPAALAREVWNDAMRHNKVPVFSMKESGTFVSHDGPELLKKIRSLVMGMNRNKADWLYDEEL